MGNTQTTEGGKGGQKSRSKIRLLGGKKGAKLEEWSNIVLEANLNANGSRGNEIINQRIELGGTCKVVNISPDLNLISPPTPSVGSILKSPLNIEEFNSISSFSPSSENQSPSDITTIVENSKDFIEIFQPLNVFKLNEYRARINQEKASKLSKLGIATTSQISLEGDGTGFSMGVFEVTEYRNDNTSMAENEKEKDENSEFFSQAGPPTYRRHMSVPIDVGAISEVSNLQKTSSSLSRAEFESRLQRPKFVPEKLDFRLYEKFEGYMLVNWYLSELNSDSMRLGVAESKLLASQFCTHLLAAGVLKQLPDPGVPPTNVFRPDCIYFWSHAEAPQSEVLTPGKLGTIFWPPTAPSDAFNDFECQPSSKNCQEKKSSARDVEIFSLEEEIKSLRQEVEKYKTLIEIQNLTASAVKDFGSPPGEHMAEGLGLDLATSPTNSHLILTQHIEVQTDEEIKHVVVEKGIQTEEREKVPSPLSKPLLTQDLLRPVLNRFPVPSVPPAPPFPNNSTVPSPPLPPPLPPPSLTCVPPPPPPPPCPGVPPPPPPPPLMSDGNGGLSSKLPPSPACPLPMPAPPPGGFSPQKAATKKAAINPPVPMKPLYWTRILVAQAAQPDDGPALWDEIEQLSIDVVPEDFTKLFSRQVASRAPTIKKQELKPKVDAVKLLDSKRSQSVGILAHSLRQDFHEIENAIYSFDTSVVSLEALQQIYEVRATTEELFLINEHLKARPEVPLDKPEQFLYDLSQIANFAERITCLTFQVEFEDAITTIGHTLENFRSSCEFLTKSPELKRVLALILTLGNYMNGGNVARGQADGFGLEVLSRLKDVKGAQTGVTLLHYVVSTYVKNDDDDGRPPPLPIPEPGDVRRALALDFDALKGELNRLRNNLTECEKRTIEVIANAIPENLQPFKNKMDTFLEKSRTEHEKECDNLEECHEMFVATMKLYLFKPKSGTLKTFAPSGFFELWLPFCVDFKDIYKKESIRIQVERAQELKRKEYREANVIKERENGLKAKFKKARARLIDTQGQEEGLKY